MNAPLFEAHRISKHFGHVQAVCEADFTVYAGEIVSLIGDNGAGKSTLVKIMAGTLRPDAGEIRVDGKAVDMVNPHTAMTLGIETVYQDLALAADLDPAANLYLVSVQKRQLPDLFAK